MSIHSHSGAMVPPVGGQAWLRRLFAHPWLIIGVITAVTVFFATQLPGMRIDNDVTAFIPADDPDRLALERMEEVFGTDSAFSVGLEIPNGTIFTADVISLIETLTDDIGALGSVDSVTSIANLEIIEGTADGMAVTPLLDQFSGSTAEIQALKERLLSWDLYRRLFVSDDFTSTQIVVVYDPDLDSRGQEALYLRIREILGTYESPLMHFSVAGEPVINLIISRDTRSDVSLLVPLVVLVVLGVLFLFFRRVGGVVLPLIAVAVSTIWTLGLMALLDVPLTLVSTVIPVLLVAVGSAYGIHLINHYYQDLAVANGVNGRAGMSREVHRDLVVGVVERVGTPVLLAGVTTVVGFGALVTSAVGPMRSFGIFTAVGVAVAVIVALLMIPALLLVKRQVDVVGAPAVVKTELEERRRPYLEALFDYFTASRIRILVFTALTVIVAVFGASRVVVDNELIGYFKSGTDIRRSDTFLREKFGGTRSFSVVVSGTEPGDLTKPEILLAMDQLANRLRANPAVGGVISYADFIKRMNQVMHVGAPPPGDAGVSVGPSADPSAVPDGAGSAAEGGTDGSASEGWDTTGFASEGFTSAGLGSDAGGSWGFASGSEQGNSGSRDASAPTTTDAPPAGAPDSPDPAGVGELLNRAYADADRADISAADLVELVNRELNYGGAAYYEIPFDPSRYQADTREELGNLISQYLLLFSGNLGDFADDALEPVRARMRVQLRATSSQAVGPIVDEINSFAAATFPPGYAVTVAGTAVVERAVSTMITDAQIRSIVVSLFLVFVIVALTFRSLVAGLYGILPLGLTLLVNFAIMGFAGIKLDVATAMVSSVAIGIGIDYTIHFLSGYRRERLCHRTVAEAEKATLRTTGRAITVNAVSVAAGFAVLAFSRFNPLMNMGILIALTMVTSSTASMTILPVLLDLFQPRFMSKQGVRHA